MRTNLFKSLLVAAMAIGAMGGVKAQTTTAFSQDFTAKTTESGEVSTDPIDYGFTKLNFVGNYTVATITDGKFTTKVGGVDRDHMENGTVEYCANFDAIGERNIATVSFYWETGDATGKKGSSKSQIYISDSKGNKVLDIAFYGSDSNNKKQGLLKINNTTTAYINRSSKVNVTSKINLSTKIIEELKVGTNTFENIPFMTNEASDISKFGFLQSLGTRLSWSNTSSIDNINITYEKITAASANYTIKFVDENGNNIKTNIIKSSLVGENPIITEADKLSFNNEDGTKKYIYVSDDAASKTIAEDGSTVVTIQFREAVKYKYTVKNNINDYAVSGTVFEGDNAKVAFSQYILKDGVLYETNKIDNSRKEFNWTFAVNKDNTVKTLNYNETTINNVAYYSEGENIDGLTIINSGNSAIRSSNSASAYAKDADVVFTTLPAGKYKLTSSICDFRGNGASAEFSYKAGEKVIFTHKAETINSDTKTSEEFTLNESTPISLVKGGNDKQGIDFIYIQRTGDETVSVSAAGYATYATKYNVEVPDNNDVEVMTVTVNKDNSTISLNKVEAGTVIPANTGILVKAAKGDYNFAVTSKEGPTLENNNLVAAKEAVTSYGAKYFALTQLSDGKVGFAVVADGVKIPAGKAYLMVEKGSPAKFFGLDGEATGINSVKTAKADGAYYTLEGVKTTKPVKGIYIHNGKKIVVK